MATNGVILLNLGNRNAAEFERLSVPDSYEKASGALTAGTYVTVYKWLYQGFMLAPSLCDAVAASDHINLVDRTNGGIIQVYPDDTITVEGGVAPSGVVIVPLQASSNGVYNAPGGVDGYNPVNIAVPSQSEPIIEPLSVSTNGVYTAPAGVDGYSPITVSVASAQNISKIWQLDFYLDSGKAKCNVVARDIINKLPANGVIYEVESNAEEVGSVIQLGYSGVYGPNISIQRKQFYLTWCWAINPQVPYAFGVNGGNWISDSNYDPSVDPEHETIASGVLEVSSNRYYTSNRARTTMIMWEY